MGETAIEWLFVINLLACFVEGGLGFGGSLTFIAMTVPLVGWTTGILSDAILASANLVATSALYHRRIDLRGVAKSGWSVAVVPLVLGVAAFGVLPEPLRVLPLLAVGAVLLWSPRSIPARWHSALAGLGVGLGNTGAPFSFLAFQHDKPAPGDTALFTAGLMVLKVGVLLVIWPRVDLPPWPWMLGMIAFGLPATWLGSHVMARWSHRTRTRFVRAMVTALLSILLVGAIHALR